MTSSTTRAFMAKKQSTTFAQVATNLLNVLQGHTESIRFVAFLLILFTVSIGTASAEKSIDFESGTATYSDWTFTNMTSQQSGSITAKGGLYYGTTGAKATASIQTKEQISSPKSISCYVSKQTTNTTLSTWYIQTSTNGSTWTDVKTQSATSMTKGSWVEFTADLSSYSNVYVRIYYSGSTAVRNIDNLVLTEGATTSYDVNWKVNGEVYETTQVTEGGKPTFPATPNSCDDTSNTFYGWATARWDGKINDVSTKTIYTSANDMPEVNGDVTYYAVFAKEGTSGSGTAGWGKVTSTADLKAGDIYAISNDATGGTYLSTYTGGNNYPASSTIICKLELGGSSGAWTFKIADGSSYDNYYLTATSTTSSNHLKAVSTVDNNCKFSISFSSNAAVITCTGKSSRNILRYNGSNNPPIFSCYSSGQSAVYLQKYSAGSTTTYSDYITTCTKETSQLATPNVTLTYDCTTATISWDNVANASAYWYQIKKTIDADAGTSSVNTTYTRDDLEQGTSYTWSVKAIGDETNYTNSEIATGTFTTHYSITYNTNGGSDIEKGCGTSLPNPLPTPTRDGFEFGGWYTDEECTQAATAGATINANTTLYAQWTSNKTATSLTWSPASYVATIDVDNTFPTLSISPNDLTGVTYSSSNTGVAMIDANGNITLVAAGTTTITATFTETATHTSAIASYTLTVHPSNCRWVEIALEDITPEDEIVVTMGNDEIGYALGTEKITNSPKSQAITITSGMIDINQDFDYSKYTWNISAVTGGYTLQPYGTTDTYLYGVTSYISIGNNNTNNIFTIFTSPENGNKCFAYVIGSNAYFLGYGKESNQDAWKQLTSYKSLLASNTLKFYKKTCLPANKFWIDYELANVTCTNTPPHSQIAKSETLALNFEAAIGYALPDNVTVTGATPSWNKATGTLTISNPTDNVTITIEALKLHTITWMVGSSSVLSEDVANGTGVTQTPSDPADDAIGSCANKFRGWSETPLGSAEGQSAPSDLCTAAQMKSNHTSVTGNKTFYAVFATEEGGGAEVGTVIFSENFSSFNSGATMTGTKNSATGRTIYGDASVTYSYKNGSGAGTKIYNESSAGGTSPELLVGKNSSTFTITGIPNGGASQLQLTYKQNAQSLTSSVSGDGYSGGTNANTKATTSTIITVGSANTFDLTFTGPSGDKNVRLDDIVITVYKGGATYSNYVTNCCELLPVTNLQVSGVTEKSATLTWTKPSSTKGITELQIRNTNDEVVVEDINPTTTTATINGLYECTKYNYYVVSVGAECEVSSETITAQPFSGAKTVNYDYNGGSGSPASFTTSCENQVITLPTASRSGYTFNGWYDAASGGNRVGGAGEEYNPTTSPITLYAQWTEGSYTLTHSGSNYTNTENKTTIKSSDTPFTLNYTCTGDYGFPSTITISGGGKSWTAGTDYVWTVAADKQSATLTINQTTISANVTITINMATRYTVTFEHNDKGVFDGESSIEVLSSENTITLPIVEDVSCGFYDTFEGWIISNDEYVESTTKPATVYAGGASYKVTGDCTFRALYSKCEGDATQVYRKVTSTGEVTDGTYILVANTSTPLVYSGHTDGKDYGDCITGLTVDGSDFSSTLPAGAVPVTVAVGGSGFSIHNGTKFIDAGTSTGVSDDASYWQLTDGSLVNAKACPQGVLQPVNNTTYVLQKNNSYNRFKTYTNSQSSYVFLYKLIDKCTKYYSTNPTCVKPVGVHIVYNANAIDASISCNTQERTYKVASGENQYPELASQLQFCTNATREGYTLAGWNTQANGQGTTYNINQNYYRLPVSGELDGDNWITLNLYAVWKQSVKFDLGNATGGTGVPDAVVENGECVLPEPTAEQLGTIPCAYEFYAWSETSVTATQSKPTVWMPGDTYTGSATTLYAVYRYAEGMGGSDTYYFTFNNSGKTYCITQKHNTYARFNVAEQSTGLIFGLENGYLYYLDEGVKTFVYWEGDGTTVTTTTTYPNDATQKTTFVAGDNGTTIVTPAISGRYLQMSGTDRVYYTTGGTNPILVEVEAATYTYATNPTCYTTANLHFVTNGGALNYPTSYDGTNYQELTAGSTVLLPTATFAGEWTFEGWKRGEPLENQTYLPYDPSFYPVTLNTTQFEVDEVGDIYFYAVYSKTVDDKQFDEVNGGTYKLYAIQSDDTKIFMPIWDGKRGAMSGVTECYLTGDYTITPGTGEHAGQYQITCGGHTLGVVGDIDQTDFNKVNGTWWNIKPSESGKGTWRITVVGSSDRALSAFSGSFGNYAISVLNKPEQTLYRDMEIGECIFTEYTSTPENIPYITVTGAPVRITSTNGERVYASTTIHIEAHNFTGERIIHLSATNGFGVTPAEVRTNGQGVYSGNVKVYYEPTTDGDGQTITTSVLTAAQTGGTNAEKISQTFSNIQGRNMPANFVIAAKWDGHWYALPANCTSSLSSTEGLLIEVDDADNPTRATQAPASAKYGIRKVIPSRQTDYGQGVVFTERYSEGNKEYSLYNNGTSANLQVYSQYSNYAATNPERYEWTPSTTDFVEYTLTNANSSRKITLNNSGVFSATTASGQVRLLPATFYEPAPVQVLKWKENSVIVMYTGAETTATTQVGTNAVSAAQTLENQKLTHGIYELTTTQALTGYARDVLVLYFGASTKVEMEIPLIVSGNVTASANGHDVVILENSKLTAAATKYSYKDVYVYGGGKLAVPASTLLGVNNIILRAGAIATNGVGANATYQYIYPQVELKGTLSSTKTDIKYEYVTDYDHWYHFVLPFNGNIKSITYPTEYYGDHVALDNTGSWVIKRYDGATRATGNYNAWVDIESEAATTTTAGKGYIFWGAPKKVSVNGGTKVRQQWGIQRITMPITAGNAITAENGDKTIEDLGSYANVANNSGAVNDQGWNLIGNPYMVNLTTMAEDGLKAGKLEKEIVDGNWTGKWINNGDDIRYLTIPSDHFDTYEAKTVSAAKDANNLVPGRAFFVQLEGEANGVTFAAANRASLMPQHLAAQNTEVEIETGIILSNETMQDEVNFWIKDGKTNDYEYNADYPKTPNNTNFNIYGVHINGDLSWVAVSPEIAEESMPIGYQVPAAGTYMLSLSETYYSDDLQALYVTDHAMSPELTVDLLSGPYEFSVNQAETNNERFSVSVRLKSENQGPTTGLENIGVQTDGAIKFIYHDKMFILHNGTIYDATGKQVTTVNK